LRVLTPFLLRFLDIVGKVINDTIGSAVLENIGVIFGIFGVRQSNSIYFCVNFRPAGLVRSTLGFPKIFLDRVGTS
jgi:hypothetical protein